ncbi:coagulation factor V-like [Xenia sp. Carnegie-2017]|uniref:coagulation factor V-like n=1 Tax=Xenia sp. Carnegie-2017 TaxID=2897299 RepID=UPI001F03FB06|nr:coagulation factor V-like [Xenia sp. Carnegie-2017]
MVDLFGGRVNKDQNIVVLILFGVCCFIFGHFFSGLVQNNPIIVDEWKDIVIFIGSLCLNIGDTILQLLNACIIPLIIICILYAVVLLDTRTAENVVRYSAIYYLGMILITVGIILALREKLGWNGIAKEEQYGTFKSPGKSCNDILQKRSEGCFPDGIYWISIEPNGSRKNAFPVFCDMKSGGCKTELGLRNGLIGDSQITASSSWDSNHGPGNARLFRPKNSPNTGAWSTRTNNINEWLQVNFLKTTKITGISTQGRPAVSEWVTSFSLSYSDLGTTFTPYTVNGNTQVFQANTNSDSVVHNKISPPIVASFIRIKPVSWNTHISLRAEFYGC